MSRIIELEDKDKWLFDFFVEMHAIKLSLLYQRPIIIPNKEDKNDEDLS